MGEERSEVESSARTEYVEVADGTHIAYQVTGSGPPDLLVAVGFGVPIQDQLEGRLCSQFLGRLASFSRVIRFDRRGMGMSDPVAAISEHTIEQWSTMRKPCSTRLVRTGQPSSVPIQAAVSWR
jgi:pimeloyl-ACP methyl ester carboxylesterase